MASTIREYRLRIRQHKIWDYFPDEGPLRRELYPKHLEFFRAGVEHRERAFIAANRVGKTESCGGYELTLHLIGEYPDWWEGRRFDRPVKVWACGDTSQTTRDILQMKLLGPPGDEGTGLIPFDNIIEKQPKAGSVPDAIETVMVRHSSGGVSRLTFKSYDQKRKSFQGTEQDVILLDEEPPMDVYTECYLRTTDVGYGPGMILATFTPLLGLSEVVLSYLPGGKA